MSSSTSRIAKNTLLLYFRQILIMLVSLYTVRIVLNVLGAEDYGIYNVVAGVVTMFGFLSGAMATASQRYFAFDLGKKDYEHLKTTFSVTFQIYVLLAAIIVVLAETVGLWFVLNKLVIPPERMNAALWIYQAAVLSFLFSLITTPYMASIIAHENMNIYAYVSIVEAVLKLAIVFLLQVVNFDKLMLYGLLLLSVTLIITFIYRTYCKKNYQECKFKYVKDNKLFKELVSYSGWNLLGSITVIVRNQGIAVLLNVFFYAVVNAAYAIGHQVNNAITSFTNNFTTALNPPLIKSYASKDYQKMKKILFSGGKFSFFILLILCLPILFEIEYILNIWLKNYPEYTIEFVRCFLVLSMVEIFNYSIGCAVQATGKIKWYQITINSIQILAFPIVLILYELEFPPYAAQMSMIVLSTIALFARLYFIKHLLNISPMEYFVNVLLRCIFVALVSITIPLLITLMYEDSIVRLILVTIISAISTIVTIYFIGINKEEKMLASKSIIKYIKR